MLQTAELVVLRRMQRKDQSPAVSNLSREQHEALFHEFLKWQEQRSGVQQRRSGVQQQRSSVVQR
jgi:hypothetical protein